MAFKGGNYPFGSKTNDLLGDIRDALGPGDGIPPIVDAVSSSVTYVGYAPLGTNTASLAWRIMKIQVVGTVTTILYPNSSDLFLFAWDNRAAYAYGR